MRDAPGTSTDVSSFRKGHSPQQDAIQKLIGAFGKYQLGLCVLIFLSKFFTSTHQLAIIFLSPKVSYVCPDTKTMTCPCSKPEFNRTMFTNTIVMEWNLICERQWMISLTQMVFQLGSLVGSILFGMASDRYGRRLPIIVAVIIMTITGIATGFVPQFWLFNVFRFVLGASVGGLMVTSFVIIMEFVGSQYRDIVSALYQVPFNVGHMFLPVLGYLLRDYVHFQVAISAPALVLFVYCFLVPETPRWLIAMKKTDEAIKLITHVAKINKLPTDTITSEIEEYQVTVEKHQLKKGTVLDLFRTHNLRKNIIIMSYNWLTSSYCFYGVSQYVGQLSGSVFINVAASAGVTLVGTLLSIPMMRIMGRKTIIIIFNFVTAACLLVLTVLPESVWSVVCASIGVVASFIVFVVAYLYCTELFPTVVRSAAVGFSSMMARVGSTVAPFVIDLSVVATWLPPLIFAILPLIAGFLTFLIPETKGCELLNTIEEGEDFEKSRPLRRIGSAFV